MSEHVAPHNMMPSKTFADFCADLWFGKTFILVGMFLDCLLRRRFVYSATPYYRAQIIISPANPMNGEQVSSMLGDDNLFAVRYLMQRVGVANSANFSRFETTYGGPSVAALLLKDPAILRGLKADKFSAFLSRKRVGMRLSSQIILRSASGSKVCVQPRCGVWSIIIRTRILDAIFAKYPPHHR